MRALTHSEAIDTLAGAADLRAAIRDHTARSLASHTPADAVPLQACRDQVPMRDGRLCTYCWTTHERAAS